MNIDCDKIIKELDNIGDDYISYIYIIIILQYIRQIDMGFGGRNFVFIDSLF